MFKYAIAMLLVLIMADVAMDKYFDHQELIAASKPVINSNLAWLE